MESRKSVWYGNCGYSGSGKWCIGNQSAGKGPEGVFLSVVVTGAQGFVVDEYKFKIQPDRLRPLSPKAGQAIRCEETAEAIVVTSLSGTYKVSKRDGLLEDYRQVLMLLPLNSTGRGIQMVGDGQDFEPYNPVCTNWVATSIEKREEEDQIEIVVRANIRRRKVSGAIGSSLRARFPSLTT